MGVRLRLLRGIDRQMFDFGFLIPNQPQMLYQGGGVSGKSIQSIHFINLNLMFGEIMEMPPVTGANSVISSKLKSQ